MYQIEIYSSENCKEPFFNAVVDKATFELIYKQFSRGDSVNYEFFYACRESY